MSKRVTAFKQTIITEDSKHNEREAGLISARIIMHMPRSDFARTTASQDPISFTDTTPEDIGKRVRLADFGISKEYGDITLTATANPIGTLDYMAPERLARERVSARLKSRSDIYSLGMTLLYLFSGQHPWAHLRPYNYEAVNSRVQMGQQPPIPRDCPTALVRIIRDCGARRPQDRLGAIDLLDDLRDIDLSETSPPTEHLEDTATLDPTMLAGVE